jgi:N4-gp56 family major capsid protein
MLQYKAPIEGQESTINGADTKQAQTFFWIRKAIITARKAQYFTQLSTTKSMPKNMGKTMTVYEYVPLLSDKNTFNQGIDAAGVATVNGNLYGSSKDIGTIVDRLPTLTENGGRVNRVGFTRLERRGSLQKMGFFYEFTAESLNFDSDADLMSHLSRETINGAVELSESVLQIDLLTHAGVVVFPGAATDDDEVSGEGAGAAEVEYATLTRLDRILTDNLTPKHTNIISGSRYTDTRTIQAARIMYGSPEAVAELKNLKDQFDEPAFIPLHKYADAASALVGEVGSIGPFRVIEVPNMLHWAGAGAEATVANPGFRTTMVGGEEHYDIFPLLVVGDEAFVTIGFQTDGKSAKFDITTKMPGRETADKNDPYGETGFSSIKWYYGILVMRPERIGLIKMVART